MDLARHTLTKVFQSDLGKRTSSPAHPWYGWAGLAALLGLLFIGVLTQTPRLTALSASGLVVAIVAGAALFLTRSIPPVAAALITGTGTALVASGHPADLSWFAVCLVAGWCALLGGRVPAAVVLAVAVLAFAGEWVAHPDPGWFAWTAGTAVSVGFGLVVNQQGQLLDRLRTLQGDLARRERAEERTRIARELHDVIAHSLTVTLLHVSSARLAIDGDIGSAHQALADAERVTRRSLEEVRATVGLLRSPNSAGGVELPAGGIDDIRQLVEDLRDAQRDVQLRIAGEVGGVPAVVGMTAYRIVQESLTNVSRHAPKASATVDIAVGAGVVEVTVDSAGPPQPAGTGMGLANMRERAAAVGGVCTAGPGGSGWVVRARLPYRGCDREAT